MELCPSVEVLISHLWFGAQLLLCRHLIKLQKFLYSLRFVLSIEDASILVGFILLRLVCFVQIHHIPGYFSKYFFGTPSDRILESVNFSLVVRLEDLLCLIELL